MSKRLFAGSCEPCPKKGAHPPHEVGTYTTPQGVASRFCPGVGHPRLWLSGGVGDAEIFDILYEGDRPISMHCFEAV